jgi:ABC-type transport system involved in cytochrome bd biosynthesis fused ATPase/permease subunit
VKSADLRLLLSWGSSRTLFIVTLISTLFSTSVLITQAFLISSVIIEAIHRDTTVFHSIALLGTLLSLRVFINPIIERWTLAQAVKVKAELRSRVSQGISLLDHRSGVEISTLLVKGLNSLDTYLGRFLPQLLNASITPLATILVLARLDLISALIAIATIPLIPFFGALIGRFTQDSVAQKWQSLGALSSYFEDSLRGFVTLKAFGRHRSQSNRIKAMGDRYTDETMKVLRISFLSALVLELAATISVALIAVSIGIRLVDGKIAFGTALTILILAPEVYFPIRSAASLFHASAEGTQVLSEVSALIEELDGEVLHQVGRNQINNGMSWPEWSLDHTGATMPAMELAEGESLLISGASGIGKTTFLSWLLLTHEVDHIGYISQSPHFASASIRQQFLYLDPQVTERAIEEALADVSLNVEDLSNGLDTHIGGSAEKGSEVSGGQLRKIAVARALFKRPSVLLADEPLADLDEKSANEISGALIRAQHHGTTLIVVSHAALNGFVPTHSVEMTGDNDEF